MEAPAPPRQAADPTSWKSVLPTNSPTAPRTRGSLIKGPASAVAGTLLLPVLEGGVGAEEEFGEVRWDV
jgi:hypothetical protein